MSGVLSPNSNDPRVIRTRQLILDAFLNQLNLKNFNSITIQNITEQATINRATFYAHFQDKYALLESLLSDAFMEYVTKGWTRMPGYQPKPYSSLYSHYVIITSQVMSASRNMRRLHRLLKRTSRLNWNNSCLN